MAVKVVIERSVSADNQAEVAELLMELRAGAIHQPGYVSGETLFSVARPGTHLVISTWESLRDWKAWETNTKRMVLAGKVEALLSSPSTASVYATTPRSIAEGV
jgi:antibiotic biosynthesis monooxygenase (ABM) superfamily enzyme